ncbi:hypothetical protein PIB30_011394 [Stylosanthes scabra]|uniref:Uncharacterized protein n=1 Tax=Stylosanthes scabra TaxID=79078 RepID=A0ABU6Z4E2_9FABA|nr:hypothetical protein [Stylosanthes scabra]
MAYDNQGKAVEDVGEDVDQTTIMNEAFVSIDGQKSEYFHGRGKGPKHMNKYGAYIQEQLATQQREASEARRRTSELLITLEGVQAQLMEEREKREEIEARFNEQQKEMQETMGTKFKKLYELHYHKYGGGVCSQQLVLKELVEPAVTRPTTRIPMITVVYPCRRDPTLASRGVRIAVTDLTPFIHIQSYGRLEAKINYTFHPTAETVGLYSLLEIIKADK